MIGELPTAFEIGGCQIPINCDFRPMLRTFAAWADPELTETEQCYILLVNLYGDRLQTIPREHLQEAVNKAYHFASGGKSYENDTVRQAKIIDWEQDENIIFPAINKAACCEVRSLDFLHWWTFLGYFGEIGDGLFSQVMHLRDKKARGKKLEKWEKEFIRENKSLFEIKKRYTREEKKQIEKINALFE